MWRYIDPALEKKEGLWEQSARKTSEDFAKAVLFIHKCDSIGKPEIDQVLDQVYSVWIYPKERRKLGEFLDLHKTEHLDEKAKMLIIDKLNKECRRKLFSVDMAWNVVWEDKVLFALVGILAFSMVELTLFVGFLTGWMTGKPTTLTDALFFCFALTFAYFPAILLAAGIPWFLLTLPVGHRKLMSIKQETFKAMQA